MWERDYEIMLLLARNGFAKINQIQKKWFPSYWSCIKRLERLKDKGYIDVFYLERNGSGIYYLTKQGLDFINSYYGTNYKRYTKSNKIPHYISCSEFYINISKDFELLDYEIEYYLDDFIPDIFMTVKKDKEIDCLIEIDNLSRTNRFLPKIDKYNKFLVSGKWEKYFDAFPRCIIITNNKTLSKILKKKSQIPFRIISFKELKMGGLYKCLV